MASSDLDDLNLVGKYHNNAPAGWRVHLMLGISRMFETAEMRQCIAREHVNKTPERFVAALDEYFSGIDKDPKDILTVFPNDDTEEQPQMIHVGGYQFYSMCAHHMAPFFGKMHFAYIPDKNIVGLSKIPRMMEIFARRPQVQEQLTKNIVDAFQELVKPRGCALLVRATHFCMEARGIKAHDSETTTTALRGCFYNEKVKNEFLMSANRLSWRI